MKFQNEYFVPILVLGFITYVMIDLIHYIVEKINKRKKKDEYNNL